MKQGIEERIQYLKKCADLYETNGTSPLTDDQYDAEKVECQKIMPDHSFFSDVGGISGEHIYGTKVAHKYIMGSLCKDPNPEEFGIWLEKTYGKDIDKLVALLQMKVDGSSFCLKYQDRKLIQAVSRGNGIVGLDYTSNAQYIRGVRQTITAQGYVEIKGEVYKNKQDFEKFCAKDFANDRNYTAGAINQKDPLITKERKLDFIAYEVRGVDFNTETEKIKFLIDNGFETLKNYTSRISCKGRTVQDVVRAVTKFMDRVDKNAMPFSVDGVVFKNDDITWSESLGTTDGGKRPKGARAIKFLTEKAETVIEGIEWNIGRTGSLTPVGLLRPVQLAGTTVKRVTLHNIKEMVERLGITKLGAKVILQKSGEIIPKVLSMVKDGDGEKIKIPDNCPSCNSSMEWDKTNTTKFCNNDTCPSQIVRQIEHFLKTIGVLGIGQGIITKLTDKDVLCWDDKQIISNVAELYFLLDNDRATKHPFQKYNYLKEQLGEKTYENILTSIKAVKEVTLPTFIEALGIANVGSSAKDIVAIAPNVSAIDNLTVDDLMKISGFGASKANFINIWKSRRDEIRQLLKYIDITEPKLSSNKLAGKSFCITGTLSKGRNEVQDMIEKNGGNVSGSVGKSLDYLICGEDSGSKEGKAKQLGVKIISEADFLKMLE